MGRFNMRLRPVYDRDEPTGGERIGAAIQGGLDWYAKRSEDARTEGNEVQSRGGVRMPDAPTPSIRDRLGGIGRRIGEVIHGTAGLEPTGTFVQQQPVRPDYAPMDEQLPATPNPDQIVTDAIMGRGGRVVPPTPPVGALPTETIRPSASRIGPSIAPGVGPSIGPANGLPTLAAASPERTFEYRGGDGARYRMPQVGERERSNKMLDYEQQLGLKEGYERVDQERQIRALIDGGMDPTEARARVLNNVVKYDDVYGPQRTRSLTYEERSKLSEEHDRRMTAAKERLARLTGAGRGNSPEALAIRRQLADLAVEKERRLAEQGAAGLDARAASVESKAIVTNPLDRRMLDRNPSAKAANDARIARTDSTAGRVRESAAEIRTQNTRANGPPPRPDLTSARAEEARLIGRGLTKDRARAAMRAAGWPIK